MCRKWQKHEKNPYNSNKNGGGVDQGRGAQNSTRFCKVLQKKKGDKFSSWKMHDVKKE